MSLIVNPKYAVLDFQPAIRTEISIEYLCFDFYSIKSSLPNHVSMVRNFGMYTPRLISTWKYYSSTKITPINGLNYSILDSLDTRMIDRLCELHISVYFVLVSTSVCAPVSSALYSLVCKHAINMLYFTYIYNRHV